MVFGFWCENVCVVCVFSLHECVVCFNTITKTARPPRFQLSGSYVEVGLLAVKHETTWI